MGVENRYHDEESTRIAKQHDEIKKQNEAKKAQKEKERLEKYDKPFQDKKTGAMLQNELHELLTEKNVDIVYVEKKFQKIKNQCIKLGIWDSIRTKYQKLIPRGLK